MPQLDPNAPSRPGRRIAPHGIIIGLCIVLGAVLALTPGQDTNFDQLNYHTYVAYAYETQRLGQDVAPGQVMHSFFSPIVYLPFYHMVRSLPPRMVGMALGALHGLNLWLVFVIARIVTSALPAPARLTMTIAAVVISFASPMAISEFGTSMTDLVVSLPVLAGLALLMRAGFGEGRRTLTLASIGCAGALLGAAASLKLTAASFAIALAVAALIGWRRWRHRLVAILATGVGGCIGFAVVGGSWYLSMWRIFGNPVFPYFNSVFRSPDYPSKTSVFDAHYLPHGFLEALSYPFLWTLRPATDTPFRDIRFALLIVLGVIALGVRLARRGGWPGVTARYQPSGQRLIVFIAVAFCLWLYEWSIQRYIVALELLTGPAIVVLLQWSGFFNAVRGRALTVTAATLAVVCAATVRAPDWGHLGWRKTWYEVNFPAADSGEHPIFLLASEALAYIVPELPPGSAVIGVVPWENIPSWGDTVFLRRIHALLADPQNRPVWSVSWGPPADGFDKQIGAYGLRRAGGCQATRGRPIALTWCPLARTAAPG